MKKRIFSILTALALCLTLLPATAWADGAVDEVDVWDGTTDTSWYDADETEFTISTAAELAGLASKVNGGTSFSGVTITLGADIVLNEGDDTTNKWTPIGNSSNSFNGTFDGQDHTVSGLYVSISQNYNVYAGLFGYVGSSGTVKNLAVSGEVSATTGESYANASDAYAGGVAGDNRGKVENCSFSGSVSAQVSPKNQGTTRCAYAGGVVGSNRGTLKNCYHTGAVTGSSTRNNGNIFAGGVVGENRGTVTNCYHGTGTVTGGTRGTRCVGGVVGYKPSGTVESCYFLQEEGGTLSGIGAIPISGYGYPSNDGAEPKTADEFASGEVAWLLQNGQTDTVWVQNLAENGDEYPVLAAFFPDTPAVHRVTFTAGETTDPTYYRNNGGTVSVPTLPTDGDYVGWYDGNTKYEAEATITVGSSDIDVVAKTNGTTPSVGIDYETEKLSTTTAMEYSTDGGTNWADCTADMTASEFGSWDGSAAVTVQFRAKAATTTIASDAQTVTIPARPAAPELSINTSTESVTVSADYYYNTTSSEYTDDGWTQGNGEAVSVEAGGSIYIYKPAVTEEGKEAFKSAVQTLTAPTRGQAPSVSIDYETEKLSTTTAMEYSTDNGTNWADCTASMDATAFGNWDGSTSVTVYFRTKVTTTAYASSTQEVTIPVRPGAPTGVQGENETVDGNHDGKITGVTTAMEYKLSTAESWTKCTGTEVTGLAPGKYQVRLAATNSDFASAAADVTIATGAARTYTLNVTAPTFDSAAYGYAQPAAKAITISNSGNSASAISGVTLSGDTSAFTLNKTDGATVQPGQSDTSYTIQPAAGLNAGTYTATITVTYQDGETAVATVSFTVTQAAQEAPADAPQLASRTTSRITLKTVAPNANGAAAEYGISTDGGTTWAWQASPEFTKLSSGKEYTFAVRYGATEDGNYAASPASNTAAFSTARHSVIVPVTPDVPPVVVTPTYPPAVDPADNGSVSVTPASPTQGDTVTVTPDPDRGYEVDSITVTDQNGNPVKVTDNGDGTYSFTQPAGKVTISVTYVCDGLTDSCPSYHFADVDTTKWYHLAVDFVVENGLMNGYDNGLFGPNNTLTRAELAQILYNKAERPAVTGGSVFTDVADGTWYADAVIWANRNGIVTGYGNGRFGPNDPITREQLAVMLWRYAGCPASTQKELRFTDADQVSSWALEAMLWATENGVVNGYSGVLNPGGTATRAEAAQMLKNFIENI